MIKNLGKFGLLLFLLAHPAILVAVFVFIFLGIINWHLALLFTGMIAFEAVSIAFLMRIKLNKTIFNLGEMENKIQDLKEDADVLARMQRELIYAGHQIKTLQLFAVRR